MYEFAPNGTSYGMQSFRYGELNLKRSKFRQNPDSAEFLLIYEQKYSKYKNGTDKVRAWARVQLNKREDFVKFEVGINDVPIHLEKVGKDVVADWYFLDGFDSQGNFWVDANGLQMMPKKLGFKQEYPYYSNNTIPANYYPVTSALVVRDFNETNV